VAAFNIDVGLLRTYGARLLAGRDFDRRDTAASTAAISTSALSAARIGLGPGAALTLIVAAVITIVAAFAALGPARRSLRLPTVDALRVDG
jgi:hypothetical protein